MKLGASSVLLGLVGAMAAVVMAGTVLAQTPTPTPVPPAAPGPGATTDYHEFYLNQFAKDLGVTRAQLDTAFTQARNDTVDQAVRDGKLTQQEADQIKSRPATAPFGGFHHERKGPAGGWNRGNGTPGPRPSPTPTSS